MTLRSCSTRNSGMQRVTVNGCKTIHIDSASDPKLCSAARFLAERSVLPQMPCHDLESSCADKSLSDCKDKFSMKRIFCGSHRIETFFALATALVALGCGASATPAQATQDPVASGKVTQISSDPFTVLPGQHATEVEPHVLANGSTLVAAFQTGRIAPGGSTDIGWATSTDGGNTWTHGFLPGLTTGEGTGPYSAASDPAVAFDAKHGVWMIESLPLSNTMRTPAVVVSRSTDGGFTWQNPVSVDTSSFSSDKSWIVCDNTAT